MDKTKMTDRQQVEAFKSDLRTMKTTADILALRATLKLRATLAAEPQTLTLTWAGRPVEFRLGKLPKGTFHATVGALELSVSQYDKLCGAYVETPLGDTSSFRHATKQKALDALHAELLDTVQDIAGALA